MMSLDEAARAVGGRILGPAARFASVSTDTRALERGALFVALRGARFDGHDFVEAALTTGAAGAMVEEPPKTEPKNTDWPLLIVEDTRQALGSLAAAWRARFALPLVAVAGSNGKTTVKEMIAAILRAHYGPEHTLATRGNLNNEIGLPLTLLGLRDAHRAAVVEIGMNHPGETANLAAIANPTVVLVNNAQREHQEFMKGVEEVAREHGAAFSALGGDGTAVINADDDFAGYWRGLVTRARVRDFGLEHRAAVTGRYVLSASGSELVISTPEGQVEVALQVVGRHNVRNAMAAAAAASAAGASLAAVALGLSSFTAVQGRMQLRRGRGGALIVDDTYNANPDSVIAAIETLCELPGRRVLVLGDMGELGERAEDFHREVGRFARDSGIDRLLATGELAAHACAEFGDRAAWYASVDELIGAATEPDARGATMLVKGSRFMRMERVVAALAERNA